MYSIVDNNKNVPTEGGALSTRGAPFFAFNHNSNRCCLVKTLEVDSSGMEPSGCNTSLDKDQLDGALAIMSSTGGASVLVCTFAVALVVAFKLYKQFAYRLALYQVLAAMLFGAASCFEVLFINYEKNPQIYTRLCRIVASLFFSLEWVKLMFTTCVTFHLFCFAVFNKNFKKLEIVYVVCSTAVPVAVASIPFLTHSYGRAGAWCWIQDWKDNCPSDIFQVGNVETFALWYGPAFVVLLLDSMAMVVMGTVLTCRAHRNKAHEPLLSLNRAHKSALNQMLPLLAYPVIFFTFIVTMFAYRLYSAKPHPPNYFLLKATAVLSPGAGLVAGCVLVLHIVIAKRKMRPVKYGLAGNLRQKQKADLGTDEATYKSEPTLARSTTYCSQLNESEVDRGLVIPAAQN